MTVGERISQRHRSSFEQANVSKASICLKFLVPTLSVKMLMQKTLTLIFLVSS